MSERKLATIERITGMKTIPHADRICAYKIRDWWVVDQINKYNINDLVVFFEIDSWIKHELAPFLSKPNETKTYQGIVGNRLRTVKLKKQISQGLILPISILPKTVDMNQGVDVTDILGIVKWELPVNAQLAGNARGNFPSFCRKTDQSRCISGDAKILTEQGYFTIKDIVDGKMTLKVASFNDVSRNIEFKKVTEWSKMTRTKKWFKITTESGKVIVCTENHKIWCDDISAYREAKNISVGQVFVIKTE